MLKRVSFWIPLVVAVALAAVLGGVVDDPFGENLASYVSAASTLGLISVTTSYVVATYQIADTAKKQLERDETDPVRQAVDAVMRSFARVSPDVMWLNVEARDWASRAIEEPNLEITNREEFRRLARSILEFHNVLAENHHLLPEPVASAGATFREFLNESKVLAEAMDDAAWAEIHGALDGDSQASLDGARRRWEADQRTQFVGAPSWTEYTAGAMLQRLLVNTTGLTKACQPHIPSLEPREEK